jgi:hypothetical protein
VYYTAGSRDEAGRFAGGTELRLLTRHEGRLYAGNGCWEDRPGPEGPQGAEILVLDAPGGRWRVGHAFEERLPNGRWRDLAVSALTEAVFATDGPVGRCPARSRCCLPNLGRPEYSPATTRMARGSPSHWRRTGRRPTSYRKSAASGPTGIALPI